MRPFFFFFIFINICFGGAGVYCYSLEGFVRDCGGIVGGGGGGGGGCSVAVYGVGCG